MNKISVRHFTDIEQSEFERMPIKQQYDLVEQLFMLFIRAVPGLAFQAQCAIDVRPSAWRQYEYLKRAARENGVLS